MESFYVNDRKWTELVSSWNETSKWSKPEDYNFLKGVIKHGYGRWTEIVQDQELNLHQAALLATGRNQQASTEPANPNTPQLIPLGQSSTKILYKPDKIISRFLRKRLQLLESALFIEFQFDSPTEFPQFTKDVEMKEDATITTEASENINTTQVDDKSDSENEILAIVDTNENDSADIETMSDIVKPLSSSNHTAEPEGDTPVPFATTSSDNTIAEQSPIPVEPAYDFAGEFAKQYENVKLTPELLELLESRHKINAKDELFADYAARVEFLSAFGEVYNLAHHLREQFVQYSKSLVTTDVLEEAHNHHFQG